MRLGEDELSDPWGSCGGLNAQHALVALGEKGGEIDVRCTKFSRHGSAASREECFACTPREAGCGCGCGCYGVIKRKLAKNRYTVKRPRVPLTAPLDTHRVSVYLRAMRSSRVLPQDIWWRRARQAEAFEPHAPTPMSSACSTPPIRSWVCGVCASWQQSVTTTPPLCTGGMPFSFTTIPYTGADAGDV